MSDQTEEYIVVCREDRKPNGRKGDYTLATRRVFPTLAAAVAYRATINVSRQPIIVAGRWRSLRFEDQP